MNTYSYVLNCTLLADDKSCQLSLRRIAKIGEELSPNEKLVALRALEALHQSGPSVTTPPLSNKAAARYLGISESTLARQTYPYNPDGPRSFQYVVNGNRYWQQAELDAYIQRQVVASEANHRAVKNQRSLLTDLLEF